MSECGRFLGSLVFVILLSEQTHGESISPEKIIRFRKQVLIANDGYYVDQSGKKIPLQWRANGPSLRFVGPQNQEFLLESNGIGSLRFYSLSAFRNGQQIFRLNDFATYGREKGFESRKVGWIVDLNRDGNFDFVQREKLQILGDRPAQPQRRVASLSLIPAAQASSEVKPLFRSDLMIVKEWDSESQSFIEKSFPQSEKRKLMIKYNFKFRWWPQFQSSDKRAKGFS